MKRPGNSRDDKSNRSPNRTSKGDDQSKKTGSTRYNKPSNPGTEKPGSKLKRNHYSDTTASGEKSLPSVRKRKPYSGRPDAGD
ncbi:MAG TPA: hypothetical protein VGM63_23005, partial [Mucilaginibacter sp.]